MKRFITRTTLLILLPVLLGVALCEYFLRKIPNDYSYKNEWLTNNACSVKILFIGGSHTFFGIEPECFSESAFNAAHVSQSLKYNYFIFSKFIDSMDSLNVFVLDISYSSMVSCGPENGTEDWRARYYSIYYGCKYHKFVPKYNLEIYYGLHLEDVANSILRKANHRTCNDLGRGITDKYQSMDWEESGAIAAKRHTVIPVDSTIFAKNKAMIEEMINICSQKNVYMIILTTPTYHTYRENISPEQYKLMVDCCNYYEQQNDNVLFLNLFADDRFQADDFYDADHLNEFGAVKLSKMLQKAIDSLNLCKR